MRSFCAVCVMKLGAKSSNRYAKLKVYLLILSEYVQYLCLVYYRLTIDQKSKAHVSGVYHRCSIESLSNLFERIRSIVWSTTVTILREYVQSFGLLQIDDQSNQ